MVYIFKFGKYFHFKLDIKYFKIFTVFFYQINEAMVSIRDKTLKKKTFCPQTFEW